MVDKEDKKEDKIITFDTFDNKTLLIIGLIGCAFCAMFVGYKDIALAVVSGLTGYLSKDAIDNYNENKEDK